MDKPLKFTWDIYTSQFEKKAVYIPSTIIKIAKLFNNLSESTQPDLGRRNYIISTLKLFPRKSYDIQNLQKKT